MPVIRRIRGSARYSTFWAVFFTTNSLMFVPLWFGGGWGGLLFVAFTAGSLLMAFVILRDTTVVLSAAGVEYVFPTRRVVPWASVASVEFKVGSTQFRFRERGGVGLPHHPQRAIRAALVHWRPELPRMVSKGSQR